MGGQIFPCYFFPDSRIQNLPHFSKNQTIFLPKNKPIQTLQLFCSIYNQDQHVGLDPHNSQHRLKNKYQALCTHAPHTYPCQTCHLGKYRPVHYSLWLGDWTAKEKPPLHSLLNWSCCSCPHYNYHNRQTSRTNRVFSFLLVKYVLSKN